jgi:hypothetical protein
MEYCAETDPQGKRLLFILQTFRDVVVDQRAKAAQEKGSGKSASTYETSRIMMFNCQQNMSVAQPALTNGTGRVSPPGVSSTMPPRHDSIASIGSSVPMGSMNRPSKSLMVNGVPAEDASPDLTQHNSVGVIDPMLDLSRVPTNPLGSEISEDFNFESMWDRLAGK